LSNYLLSLNRLVADPQSPAYPQRQRSFCARELRRISSDMQDANGEASADGVRIGIFEG